MSDDVLNWIKSHYFGKYRGIVTDVDDSDSKGRVKVRVPSVLADQEIWAMPCVPYAGDQIGHYMIPKVESAVWVEFEAGDPSFPIWSGAFWAENELPADGPGQKKIKTEEGYELCLDDDGTTIELKDDEGNNHLTIDVGGGEIKLQASSKVIIDAPQIELVEGAGHPLAYGDELVTFLEQLVQTFNSHMHVGEMAPMGPVSPAPPTPMANPPIQPQLVSQKVKTD